MKWEPDWSDIADNLLIGLMVLAVLRIQAVRAQADWHGSAVWHDR